MIVLNFPTLKLEQVYALLTYYLYNRSLFDAYLHEAERTANQWFEDYEARSGVKDLRQQLLCRNRPTLGGRIVNVGKP